VIEVETDVEVEVDRLKDEKVEEARVDRGIDPEMKDDTEIDVLEIVHETEAEAGEEYHVVHGVVKNHQISHLKREINVQCFVCNYLLVLGLEIWKNFLQLLEK
jgi:hypothetical protein